jgi:Fe2+ or Zn2+ uptake regulation protein
MADCRSAPEALLRAAGLRVTAPRIAVLTVLASSPHSRADAVIGAVREDAEVSTQAVYDVLNTLTERGLVRRFQPAGAVACYELHTGDNHHHVVCRSCGSVTDVECATGETPCLDLPSTTDVRGFAVDQAEVTWWGVCLACRDLMVEPTAHATQ